MNSMLATEAAVTTEEKRPALPPLEAGSSNELMRHVPATAWMVRKLDSELRTRLEKLLAVYSGLAAADPRHASIDTELRALCKTLERLAESVKPGRHHTNGSSDLPSKITALLNHAISCLRSLESTAFGRRNPYHLFEKSKAECVYAALLSVICHVERIVPLVRAVDPSVDERLLAGLVTLSNPVDDRMLKPIA